MGIEFVKGNIAILVESINNYSSIVKQKGANSEEARAVKNVIVGLCSEFKKSIEEVRKGLLKDA